MPTPDCQKVLDIIEQVEEMRDWIETARAQVYERPHNAAGNLRAAFDEANKIRERLVEVAEKL